MRQLVYCVACSVDLFIAREDGSIDFHLSDGDHLRDLFAAFPETLPAHLRETLGVDAPNQRFDAVLMGRRTYEVGERIGITSPYPHLEQFLFSRTLRATPDGDVQLVSGDPVAFVRALKTKPGKDIWLCGGAVLATTLFTEIDELILKVNPVLLGSGIPLFSGVVEQRTLELVHHKVYANGFLLLRYQVRH